MIRFSTLAVAAAAIATASFAIAQQPSRVQLGVLECRGGASIGFIVGSVTNLSCVLRADGRPDDFYVARIQKVGVDLGITEQSALAWGVFAPVGRFGPGDLAGSYGGAQSSAAAGVGVGANWLYGGSNNSIALQPLSVQGQVGLSVAASCKMLRIAPRTLIVPSIAADLFKALPHLRRIVGPWQT